MGLQDMQRGSVEGLYEVAVDKGLAKRNNEPDVMAFKTFMRGMINLGKDGLNMVGLILPPRDEWAAAPRIGWTESPTFQKHENSIWAKGPKNEIEIPEDHTSAFVRVQTVGVDYPKQEWLSPTAKEVAVSLGSVAVTHKRIGGYPNQRADVVTEYEIMDESRFGTVTKNEGNKGISYMMQWGVEEPRRINGYDFSPSQAGAGLTPLPQMKALYDAIVSAGAYRYEAEQRRQF